ncbi:hypothetical protein PUN28_006260 [Cardiocondyla obscurior]|uniref:Uncharacterized protein n=1 Tax=Cardiocondyla obscurior TaxID=286306 RepID=A0AAW2G9X6_9HYME
MATMNVLMKMPLAINPHNNTGIFRPEVLGKWLLNHFRTRKKSNECMMEAVRETEGIDEGFRIIHLKIGSKEEHVGDIDARSVITELHGQ